MTEEILSKEVLETRLAAAAAERNWKLVQDIGRDLQKLEREEAEAKLKAVQDALKDAVEQFRDDFKDWLKKSGWLKKVRGMSSEHNLEVQIKAIYGIDADYSLLKLPEIAPAKSPQKHESTGTNYKDLLAAHGDKIVPESGRKTIQPYSGMTFKAAFAKFDKDKKGMSDSQKSNTQYDLKCLMDRLQ